MASATEQSHASRFLITLAAFVVVVAGMKAAQVIIVPFLLAVFISIVCAPALFWLKRRRVPTVLAILLLIVGIIGAGFFAGALVGKSVADFRSEVPHYTSRLEIATKDIVEMANNYGLKIPDEAFAQSFDPSVVMQFVANALNELGSVLANGFLILLTVVFILLETSSFSTKLQAVLRNPNNAMRSIEYFLETVNQYVAIKTLISLATGLCIALWLFVLGVDFPILWGMLAFLLNFIPNLGSIIAGIPAVLLAFVQLGLSGALFTTLGYVVINVVLGNILEPRFLGRGLGLSSLVVFLSLVFWGWVLGLVGMLLSVPLTMTLKIALQNYPDTKWVGLILGDENAAKAEIAGK